VISRNVAGGVEFDLGLYIWRFYTREHLTYPLYMLKKWTEDWTAVWIGWSLLLCVVSLHYIPLFHQGQAFWKSDMSSISFWGSAFSLFIFSLIVMGMGALLMKQPWKFVLSWFPLLFILTCLANGVANLPVFSDLGLEAVLFSLLFGLLIGHLLPKTSSIRKVLQAEFFVKIGLVLLGSTVLFSDIVEAGALGMLQALVVVVSVWYFAFWVCKKLKIDRELSMMISSAVSICGVSAAIATAGAIQGDGKKLSLVITLVLVTAIPMMIGMPYLATWMGLSDAVAGAWIGGSIDTTGAVVASGSLLGDEALKISTIVKFSQNLLLGIAALVISIYWTIYSVKSPTGESSKQAVSWKVIWERFPKFVIGFLGASLFFSFVIDSETVQSIKGEVKQLQTWWFALAFTSIGLETNFKDLFQQDQRKGLWAFLIAQLFNVLVTLIIAQLIFGDLL
jgi:uncharacterized integral membrane protein (TIGR00698 family)